MLCRMSRPRALRLALLVVFAAVLFLVGHLSGATEWLSLPRLRVRLEQAGPTAPLIFAGALILAVTLHLPGLPFVIGGITLFGRLRGALILWGASLIAISITFAMARTVGGQLIQAPNPDALGLQRPFLRRILWQLLDRPVRTVFLLRLFLALFPPLNFALAVTGIRFRHYLLGSALGLIPPLAFATLWVDWVARLLLRAGP